MKSTDIEEARKLLNKRKDLIEWRDEPLFAYDAYLTLRHRELPDAAEVLLPEGVAREQLGQIIAGIEGRLAELGVNLDTDASTTSDSDTR